MNFIIIPYYLFICAPWSLEASTRFGEMHSTEGSKAKKASVQLQALSSAPCHNSKTHHKPNHTIIHHDSITPTLGNVASTA